MKTTIRIHKGQGGDYYIAGARPVLCTQWVKKLTRIPFARQPAALNVTVSDKRFAGSRRAFLVVTSQGTSLENGRGEYESAFRAGVDLVQRALQQPNVAPVGQPIHKAFYYRLDPTK